MISEVFNMDCMEYMKNIPDKFFELAIVDPPYGIGFSDYERGGQGKCRKRYTKNGKKRWDDNLPSDEYFEVLFAKSKNQIIWGGNYFELPPTQGFIFWFKGNPAPTFSDGEYAWTSFQRPAKCFDFRYYSNLEGKGVVEQDKIHPTQKPVALYKWLISNYAKPNDKIFDSHLGSGSSRIAAHEMKFDFYGCELDKDYFQASCNRFNLVTSQLRLL